MTHEEMITAVIRKYGFEHDATIRFCKIVEHVESIGNHWIGEAFLEGVYKSLMR